MTSALDRWLAAYVRAWDSNAEADIGDLFTDDAEYRAYPWAPPVRGRDEIVAWWRSAADRPGDHRFSSAPIGADGNRHFVQGRTVYEDGRVYENLWIVDLAEDGRASSFTEWYMESESKALGPKG
jgi:ketosteroid isomerase-like protein